MKDPLENSNLTQAEYFKDIAGTVREPLPVLDKDLRVRVEEGLRLLASIIESNNDAIIGKTLEGTILSWNPGAEKLYGYQADEVIGKSVSIIVPRDKADELTEILKTIGQDERFEN